MYKKGAGNDKQGKDAGNRTLCPYKNFSQAIQIFTTSRPATAVAPYKGVLRQDEVCQIFNEVGGTGQQDVKVQRSWEIL